MQNITRIAIAQCKAALRECMAEHRNYRPYSAHAVACGFSRADYAGAFERTSMLNATNLE